MNRPFFRFREFPVYQEAKKFRRSARELSKKFPRSEDYVLKSQLWRALDSIALNIAEGSERYSDLDFSHFLNNSLTSLAESVACLDLALDNGYINQQDFATAVKEGENLGKQLKAFSSYVRPGGKRVKY